MIYLQVSQPLVSTSGVMTTGETDDAGGFISSGDLPQSCDELRPLWVYSPGAACIVPLMNTARCWIVPPLSETTYQCYVAATVHGSLWIGCIVAVCRHTAAQNDPGGRKSCWETHV